ncbi:MAG TPA: phosphotransferase family protein [Candidatus Hydrogenedentes bacterium]|nr:phosphotransferase family protein [Candidatus Hydrogenedentota bacterium]
MSDSQQIDIPELTEVREAHRFDEAALAYYLNDHIDDDFDSMHLRQFEGGQSNPTYCLDTADRQYVLRKKPPGELLKSAHQIDREYRVMHALRDTDVPVPKMYCLCEDASVIGQDFYVMQHVEGRVIVDPRLPNVAREDRKPLYDHLMQVLAALHCVNRESVGLGDFGRPGNYYERQISRWSKQYKLSETETIDEMDALIEWFPANIPQSDETTIVHGDFRVGNMIVHPTEPRVMAVLDWELATSGHPLGDLGYNCSMYYGENAVDVEETGLYTEHELVDMYCRFANREPIENWPFYIIYNLFRSAAIVQGVYKRGLDGNASSETWREREHQCRDQAELAWSQVEKL